MSVLVKRKAEDNLENKNAVKKEKKDESVSNTTTTIQKLNDIDHCLHSADMFIGQTCYTTSPPVSRFVYNRKTELMEYKTICYPHGLLKIFDEALVNAADNRHKGTTVIKIGINVMQNAIWIFNNGPNFEIIKTEHESRWSKTEKAYQPELAFFHLKTSSAYGKEKRITGGKFGLGSKLISIFSLWCTVEMCDGNMYYYQKCSDHMNVVYQPTVRPANTKEKDKPYISICFSPDLSLFYPKDTKNNILSEDMIDLFMTRALDISGTVSKDIKVMWSLTTDKFIAPKLCKYERLPIKGFKDYVKLFLPPELKDDTNEVKIGYHTTDRWEVCMIRNPWPFSVNVSFVNNINTYLNGEHVKYIQSQIFQYCKTKVEGIDARRVNSLIMLFVNATIEDASFNSQTKESLQTIPSAFGSKCELPGKFLNTLSRNGVIDALKSNMETKEMAVARKTIGAGKKKAVHDIPNFRDARHAGTRNAHKCTLYFVEGVSAMELAEIGLSVVGNDYFGAFALKGKVINVDTTVAKLQKNKEFVNICRALGLELGKPTPLSQLRYGKIVLLTDRDADGSHIQGLFMHLLSKFWPHLLKENNFLDMMLTPIIVARSSAKKKAVEYFYTLQSFEKWYHTLSDSQLKSWQIKYYKGLATSTAKEGRYYFKNLRDHLRNFIKADDEDFQSLDMVFSKGNAQKRKDWLKRYDANCCILYDQIKQLSIQQFINNDMKHYSWMSVKRSIPLCEDGLSGAARKCIWVFLKRNITKDVKVATVQSWVDNDTNYHHGPDSLGKTIVRLAQNFVGKQNLNVFIPSGQFGTRIDGGKTHGATRYVHTRLCPITRFVFRAEDDNVLTLQEDEGKTIEPVSLAPIIPMILVNGSCAIATGFSSDIPTYKPEDLIQAVRRKIQNESWQDLQPWYHKFQGVITGDAKGNFESTGVAKNISKYRWNITELPIGEWRDNYKMFLSKMIEKGDIKEFHEQHREENVCFEVECKDEVKDPVTFFKLKNKYSSQLNLFIYDGGGHEGLVVEEECKLRITSFQSIEEIFNYWYNYRLKMYEVRRQHILKMLRNSIPFLEAKVSFIKIMLGNKLPLGQKKQVLYDTLTGFGIPKEFHDNLLHMSVNTFSEEKIALISKELSECREQIQYYEKVLPTTLWLNDLLELEKRLPAFWADRIVKSEEDDDD
jgi:DNA topoisomerase-2